MSIYIQSQPTSPNMANNDLLFVVTSSLYTQPQYQYVMDIYLSGSDYIIQRVKQQPNPSGYGVFNVGQLITANLSSDNVWKTAGYSTSSQCNKDFVIKFGEQIASSSFDTPVIYNGVNVPPVAGSPAKTGSAWYTFTDGLVDYPNAVNFNFNSGSYYTANSASQYITFNYQHALTNAPSTQSIQEGEYHTLSFYNGNMDNTAINAQDIFYCQITWYNSAGSVLQNDELHNTTLNGGAPRTNTSDLWGDVGVYDAQYSGSRLIHFGGGVQNLADIGYTAPSGWDYYTLVFTGQGDDGLENNDGVWGNYKFTKSTGECAYNGVRFTWKNEFGVWDYYTFTLADGASNNIERTNYEHVFVPYNTSNPSISYDTSRRGTTPLVNKVKRVQTANSAYLTQAEADWLRELFFSTNVFIQVGSDFYPVTITDASVTEKTNPRTQKVFQYQITFEYANQLRQRM